MELTDYLGAAKRNIFRFEYLQDFSATDKAGFDHWKQTGTIDTAEMKEWWAFLEGKHMQGVITERVRNVVLPLFPYVQYEIAAHRLTAQHKDRIRIITEETVRSFGISLGDFWLIDDEIAIKMLYGERGVFLGIEKQPIAATYVVAKELLLAHSTPIEFFQRGTSRDDSTKK